MGNQNDEFSETGQYLGTMPTRAEAAQLETDLNLDLGRIAEMNAHLEQASRKYEVTRVTVYLDPTSTEAYHWYNAGRCVWCGSTTCGGDRCRLRHCESCTRNWVASTLADVDDGHVLTREYCPPCKVWLASTHGSADGVRTLCGSSLDDEVKAGSTVTCSECLPVWNNLHLSNPAYSSPGGDPL